MNRQLYSLSTGGLTVWPLEPSVGPSATTQAESVEAPPSNAGTALKKGGLSWHSSGKTLTTYIFPGDANSTYEAIGGPLAASVVWRTEPADTQGSSVFRVSVQRDAFRVLRTTHVAVLSGKSAEALRVLLSEIEGAFSDGNLDYVDAMLGNLDPESMPRVIWIGALRSTFRAREHLQSWHYCLARVARHLALHGQNPNQALPGLLQNNDRNILAIGASLL